MGSRAGWTAGVGCCYDSESGVFDLAAREVEGWTRWIEERGLGRIGTDGWDWAGQDLFPTEGGVQEGLGGEEEDVSAWVGRSRSRKGHRQVNEIIAWAIGSGGFVANRCRSHMIP